jgi:hypothetical protein
VESIILISGIICFLLIVLFVSLSTNTKKKVKPNNLSLINDMNVSNNKSDGFCIENAERPSLIHEKNKLYLTSHINSVINNDKNYDNNYKITKRRIPRN